MSSSLMYPDGYPRSDDLVCGHEHTLKGAVCIIDNKHVGRNHWGPDRTGRLVEWTEDDYWSSGRASLVSRLSLALST